MIRPLRVLTPTVLLAGAVTAGALSPSVAAVTACTITQITDTSDTGNFSNTGPVISADGTRIAFESDQNHTGFNAEGNQEIMIYDIPDDEFVRVSSTAGGMFANRSPAIDADGSNVVWTTDRPIADDNMDRNREIARWTEVGDFSISFFVTDTTAPITNGHPSIDDAGDDIVFTGGDDAEAEIYRFQTAGQITTRLTDTVGVPPAAGESYQPHINGPGTLVVFASSGMVDDLNANGGSDIHLVDLSDGSISAVTNTLPSVASTGPAISNDGRRVAFTSDGSFPGLNPDLEEQAFHIQLPSGAMTQLTQGAVGQFGVGGVAISAKGTRVAFDSDGNHAGMNSDGSAEVYVHDFARSGNRITQITDSAIGSGEVDIDASGTRIVFSSRADHTGDNADGGREIFMATCEPPPKPALCNGVIGTVDLGKGQEPTSASDVILGTPGNDTVNALNGSDVFCGLGGADVFEGGVGNDWADGGAGPDTLMGGKGADRLRGGKGADVLNGMAGDDTCLGGPGQDSARKCETLGGVP